MAIYLRTFSLLSSPNRKHETSWHHVVRVRVSHFNFRTRRSAFAKRRVDITLLDDTPGAQTSGVGTIQKLRNAVRRRC